MTLNIAHTIQRWFRLATVAMALTTVGATDTFAQGFVSPFVGFNFGGGLRYYLSPKIGIRFETKQLFTRVDSQVTLRKELLIFQSSSLGVIFAFG